MHTYTAQFLAQACGGKLLAGSATARVSRICTDSRQVQAGDAFFALCGDRFDGHDFLSEVVKRAAAVVIERQRTPALVGSAAVIVVGHTRQALGRLAAEHRGGFDLPLVAVGGSNGKTTTKEIVASVLRQKLVTLKSEASFNNDIGVPLTLLKLEKAHQVGVLEVGTNHPGELEPLVNMIRPRFGIITSIGREHLEFFGNVEAVAREQSWVGQLLPAAGKLFLNGDSEWAGAIAQRTPATVVRLGLGGDNAWRATRVRPDKQGVTFQVETPDSEYAGEYRVNLVGRHQAINALFGIALGRELGLNAAEIDLGLRECTAPKMRMEIWESNGVRILDDAYNANADSMAAALQTLQELPCKGRRVAVLGDMAELGAHSEEAHREVGRRVAELGIGQLFAVGKMAPLIARGAREAGLNRIFEFADVEAAGLAIRQFLKEGDLLLLKASRATRLERIGDMLRGTEGARKN